MCKPLALRPAGILDGFKNLGTPVMRAQECILCMECVRVCHTGALQKVPKEDVDIGCGVIDKRLCWAWLRKKRCKICFKDCPLKAIEMERRRFPVIIEEKCNGCGICAQRCQWGALKFNVSIEKAGIDQYRCFGCGLCETACPRGAIILEERTKIPTLKEVW